MLKKGIPGADQLSTTRRLAKSVPPLALAYLNKLALGPGPAVRNPIRTPRCPHGSCSADELTATTVIALSENQFTRLGTLVAGFVVLLVVIALLEGLRRAVNRLHDDIWSTWVNGKAVVKNTAMT